MPHWQMEEHHKLYYLNNAETLPNFNMNNVSKPEHVVEDIKITTKGKPECEICVQGKVSQYQNREPARSSSNCSHPVDP